MTSPNLPTPHTPFTCIRALIGGEEVDAVDARSLFSWLRGVTTTKFADWWTSRIAEALFIQGEDFETSSLKNEKPQGGRPALDYVLTVDAAMHVAMLERTEMGRMVRQDAIEWKKRAKAAGRGNARTDEEVLISLGVDPASATMLVTNRRKMEALSAQQAVTDTKADRALEMAAQAKAHYIPSECYSVMAWANLNDIAITLTPAAQIGKIATAYSRANNLPKDLISDPRFGVAGVYMKEALEHAFDVYFKTH